MELSKFTTLSLLLVALCGCQSGKFTHYTSPEVTGRVLAADTHQPLADVKIQRDGSQNFEPFGPPKGGQVLIQNNGVRTDADGRFILDSKSVFTLFRAPGWWSVPVIFSHSGYESFRTNYTGTNVTSHSDAGAPIINAGDILLQPMSVKNSSAMDPQP
jgi:hypothetical protein